MNAVPTVGTSKIHAMILAAGAATRACHLTDPTRNRYPMAKPRFPLITTPVMDHWVMELGRAGVREVFANIWSNPDTIDSFYAPGSYADGRETKVKLYREKHLMGTMGSAVHWAQVEGVSESDTLVVLSGDIASNADLQTILAEHHRVGSDLTVAFNSVPWSQVHKYGTAAFKGMPVKRPMGAGESEKSYREYLQSYQDEIDIFAAQFAYQALEVTAFKEKVDPTDAPSNLNNASIYVLSGALLFALAKKGITALTDTAAPPFNDFGRHGFPFVRQQGFKFYGVILPEKTYWMDIGDLGKFWLAIMDTLDGRFDRSMWGLYPKRKELLAFVHPTAVIHHGAQLFPPYFVGENAEIGCFAQVGPYAVVSSGGVMQRGTVLRGSAMIETARWHQGDRDRRLEGSEIISAQAERSLLAGGVIHPDQRAQNNAVIVTPDGHTRFTPLGMDRDLSERRLTGRFIRAVET